MNLPEFTAEESLWRMAARWVATTDTIQRSNAQIVPQRAMSPYGPIGLPGQDCEGACVHMCMTFGTGGGFGSVSKCLAKCRYQCGSALSYGGGRSLTF